MTKTTQKRPDAKPEKTKSQPSPILQHYLAQKAERERVLQEEKKHGLTLAVTIPASAVPLFKAVAAAAQGKSNEDFAAWAIIKGITCEEAMQNFDDLVNSVDC